jgi:hypothetical protein
MAARKIELASIQIPDFGIPQHQPLISPAKYEQRIELARAWARNVGLDFLLVYGDREHFANLAYLTDHDPRFEEALLVLASAGGQPSLILGNEGLTYSELMPITLERRLYQGFSLLGQKRDTNPRLEPVLRACGLRQGNRVGLVGWKYVTSVESDDHEHWLDAPAFIVDALRTLTGDPHLVTNATALFVDPVGGLRVINSVDQLAAFEFAATHCSQMGRNIIEHLQPGLTELEAVQKGGWNGLPLSCHLMFSSGPRARLGLPSPIQRTIQRGDPFFMALGLRGSLIARGGFVIADAAELPAGSADYLDHLVKPYFATVVAWYEQIGLGVSGGELQASVDEAMAGSDFGLALNPGHLIHLDEWLHSPIYPGSEIRLRSGMLIQCDIIPVIEAKYHTTNVEDTIALADLETRAQLAQAYPEVWQRIQARRAFMQEVLGIRLKPEVLPFSNMPALLQPFALSPNRALVAVA